MVQHAQMLLGCDLPVELGGVDLLVAEARREPKFGAGAEAEIGDWGCAGIAADGDVGVAVKHSSPVVGGLSVADALARGQGAGIGVVDGGAGSADQLAGCGVTGFSRGQRGLRQSVELLGIIWNAKHRKDVCVLVIGIDPEELVLDQRPADREAINLAQIFWLDVRSDIDATHQGGDEGVVVHGRPFAFAIPEIGLPVELVGAALGDRGDDAAGGAPVLSRVDAGVDGKLADSAAGGGIGFTGAPAFLSKEGLIVVGAIDLDVVEQCADAADADETVAVGINCYARSGEGKSRPAAVVNGDGLKRIHVERALEVGRLKVEHRRLFGDLDGGRGRADRQTWRNICRLADLDNDVIGVIGGKAGSGKGHPICAGLQQWGLEKAAGVGSELDFVVGPHVVDGDGGATYHANNVIVQVGQPTDVSPRLTVGASSTSIEVTEQAPVLNLESPDFQGTLN